MITLTVRGTPAPQGSKSFKGMRPGRDGRQHAILVESSKKVKPWREDVKLAAERLCRTTRAKPLDGPLVVEMIFTLRKPASAPKTRVTYPSVTPDLSKLVRSTEDALTDAGLWADDARVIECWSCKRYPNEGEDALDTPGVVIRVCTVEEHYGQQQLTIAEAA